MESSVVIAPVSLSRQQQDYINETIFGDQIAWYRLATTTNGKFYDSRLTERSVNNPCLTHPLLYRADNSKYELGEVASPLYNFFLEIFNDWMKEQNLKYNYIFRASINLTHMQDGDYSEPHVDHDWPHYNWIIYLTNTSDAGTVLFNDDYTIDQEIPCKKFTAVSFKNQLHSQRFTKTNDHRIIVVFTYGK
jgi:hypothetical protein